MTVDVTTAAGVCTITLNNPKRKNAITTEMFGQLRDAFDAVSSDAAVGVVVLCGAGDTFSSGADLTERPSDEHRLLHVRWVARACAALHACPKPIIAKVRGAAVGGAANLAFGCDLIVAAEDARFSEIFVRHALSLDCGGSYILPRLIGLHKANELAFLGETVSAADAYELGLLNRVVAVDEIDDFVASWARKMAASAPLALSMTKRLLQAGGTSTLQQALEAESVAAAVNLGTDDAREAFRAFREKRKAVFTGR